MCELENPDQLPVSQVLGGTDDRVSCIFVIPSFSTLSRSRIFHSSSKLACLEDFENSGQPTVSQVLSK